MGRSVQSFEKRRRELDKKQKQEAKRLKKAAKKNGDYVPLPEIYVPEEMEETHEDPDSES